MSIFVEMSAEDVAAKWLSDNALCAIDWETLNALIALQIGNPIVYFDTSKRPTYKLIKQFDGPPKKPPMLNVTGDLMNG